MSMSQTEYKKEEIIIFHGKPIQKRKFQKKMGHKPTIVHAVLINTVLILTITFTIWFLIIIGG
jgi:hypothetical protein